MKRLAIEEGLVPAAVVAGLQEMGFSLWYLPRTEASETHRLLREFPPDVVILPLEPRTAMVAERLAGSMPSVQVVVAAQGAIDLDVQPSWADLVVPLDADPIFWLLSLLAMRPEEDASDHGPAGWRRMLLTAIDKTHHAHRSLAGRPDQSDAMIVLLRQRLGDSFEMLLRILLDRLEREVHGFAGHSGRVARLAGRMAEWLGLEKDRVEAVRLAGSLHDLGMHLVLPSQALRRPGPLHQGEWDVIRSHPIASAAVLEPLSERGTATATAIREHHERLDGSGYPMRKRGDEISIEARIVTVADAWEAMTHPRPHRSAVPADQAIEALRSEAASGLLDADVCEALPAGAGI